MNLKTKIQVFTAFPAMLLVLLGAASLSGFWLIHRQIQAIYDDRVIPLQQIKMVSDAYAISIVDATNKANAGSMSSQQALNSVTQALEEIDIYWEEYQQTQLTPKERELSQEAEELFSTAEDEIAELQEILREGDRQKLDRLDRIIYNNIDPITAKLNELIELQLRVAEQKRQVATRVLRWVLSLFIPLLVLTVLLVLSPLRKLLSQAITATVEESVENLASASTEIAVASEQQERIASQQASSVQETSTTMDQLEISSRQSAEQAKNVVAIAQRVLNLSQEGNEAVNQTIAGMNSLDETVSAIATKTVDLQTSAQQISTIAKLVNDFANQTNMLALNASIEAVRAGVHGQGFSVVAGEIRKLAEQSQNSSQNIGKLAQAIQTAIQSTIEASEQGTNTVQDNLKLAQMTADTFAQVNQAVEEMVNGSQQISLTVQQEAIAFKQIVQAMNDLNQVAKETASGLSQTKTGTQKLKETADQLRSMV